jgi:hypothetical protein
MGPARKSLTEAASRHPTWEMLLWHCPVLAVASF